MPDDDNSDIPDELRELLADESRQYSIDQLDEHLRRLALAQKQAGVRTILTTVEVNGDVTISVVLGPGGASYVPYARVDRLNGQLVKPKKKG